MVNLKSRIENLKKETGAMAVKELCEKAIAQIEDINEMHTSLTAKSEIENGIIEKFISDVKRMKVNDTETRKFLEREERFFNINNLGVKAAINKIAESDLTEHPALRYAINAFAKRTNVPEYIIAEEFVSVMHPFEWHPVVKECLSVIREKANENKEDFIIWKHIKELFPDLQAYYKITQDFSFVFLRSDNLNIYGSSAKTSFSKAFVNATGEILAKYFDSGQRTN